MKNKLTIEEILRSCEDKVEGFYLMTDYLLEKGGQTRHFPDQEIYNWFIDVEGSELCDMKFNRHNPFYNLLWISENPLAKTRIEISVSFYLGKLSSIKVYIQNPKNLNPAHLDYSLLVCKLEF